MKLYKSNKSNGGMGMAYQAKHVYLFLSITTLSSSKLHRPQHTTLSNPFLVSLQHVGVPKRVPENDQTNYPRECP